MGGDQIGEEFPFQFCMEEVGDAVRREIASSPLAGRTISPDASSADITRMASERISEALAEVCDGYMQKTGHVPAAEEEKADYLEQPAKPDEPTGLMVLPWFAGAGTPSMDANTPAAIAGLRQAADHVVYLGSFTKTIWLRRHFTYAEHPERLLRVTAEMFHDEDAEIYLNGRLILSVPGYNTDWTSFTIPLDAFAAAVKAGDNVLAVKVKQAVGGQYFDLGLSIDVAK